MPRFAANLSMLFTELPFLDRFDAAAKAGFEAVEFMFPYGFDAAAIRDRLDRNGLALALHNLPAGDWDGGDRGIAIQPDRVDEFRSGIGEAIEYAKALGAPRLNCLVGRRPDGVDEATLRRTLVDNLRVAADELARADLKLLVEPVNTRDIPGFYLNRSDQAIALLDEVGSDNLYLQYDIYHMQRMEGELAATMERLLPRIGHIQVADNPGRNEPGTGEIDYRFLFGWLDRIGYDGWIGCEYKPRDGTVAGLGWRDRLTGPEGR